MADRAATAMGYLLVAVAVIYFAAHVVAFILR